MQIEIIKADITKLKLDAIVNAANSSLMGGGGVDGAIHRAAGKELKQYCSKIGGCKTGEAKITPAFNLPCKYIIHTVGPVWNNGTNNEKYLLENCYTNSLKLAFENGIKTMAFPCISTGAYRFPFDKAAVIALNTIISFLNQNNCFNTINLVVFNESDFEQYLRVQKKYFH
ncbi:MAG: O-acetyl-ADP-ribose deacetylase [Chitinophagaceae bacterium]